jgi:hypothetical protein
MATTETSGTSEQGIPSASPMPPHLLSECDALYVAWRPEDPDAAYECLPEGLERPEDPVVSLFQGAQRGAHTSWGGVTSISHAELELPGNDALDGRSRGRWWALYLNGDPWYLAGAQMLGVPGAQEGRTEMLHEEAQLTATTFRGEMPIVRTTAEIGGEPSGPIGGQFRYLIPGEGFPSILVPYACESHSIRVLDIEFLDRGDPAWALRPGRPLEIAWSVYSPRFCYAFSAPVSLE